MSSTACTIDTAGATGTPYSGTDDHLVLAEVRDGIAWLTINRPQKRNALNRATLDALREAFETVARNEALHVTVLTGAGDKSFAAGGDLREFDALRSAADAAALFDHAAAALDAIRAMPVPVIAAFNGTALGGGAELALACDYRVAAAHARIGFVQATLAITTGFSGAEDLFALLGPARAMRLLAESEVLSASAAYSMGLIDAVCADDEPLADLVARFAQPFTRREPHVIRAIRQVASAHRNVQRDKVRSVERDAFVATWTAPSHWAAAQQILNRSGAAHPQPQSLQVPKA